MVIILLKNDLDFFNISANREMISKNNFMLTLRPIKYKFYSLIGLNFITHQYNILHIHLHPLNMHVLLQPVPKLLHGPSPVDSQLNLTIHHYVHIQLTHKDQTVDAALYKLPGEDTLTNTKHIIQQNNFRNTNLHTIGKQLTRLKKHIQKNPVQFITDKNTIDLKLKTQFSNHIKLLKLAKHKFRKIKQIFLEPLKHTYKTLTEQP